MSDATRIEVDESPDPVHWLEAQAAPDMQGALWGLYYAIYYGGVDQFKALPDPVLKAYARIQGAAGV